MTGTHCYGFQPFLVRSKVVVFYSLLTWHYILFPFTSFLFIGVALRGKAEKRCIKKRQRELHALSQSAPSSRMFLRVTAVLHVL